MIELINAARAVQAVRPSNWNDGEDPEAEAAWSALEKALVAADTHSPSVADPVRAWLQSACITAPACAPNARELFPTLFESYCAWCVANGLTPLLASPFGTALKHYGIVFAGKNNRGQRWRSPVMLKASGHD